MGRLALGVSGAAGQPVVRGLRHADLPTARLLLVVVLLRCLCAHGVLGGRRYRGLGRLHLHRRGHHHVGGPRARGRRRRYLWLSPLGEPVRGRGRRASRLRRCRARQAGSGLPAP